MAISSLGIGSGLNVNDIIEKMVALQKAPLTNLTTAATKITSQISTYGQIKSLMSTLNDAASKLTLDSTWNAKTVSSSNSAAVNATITGVASDASFSVGVSQLARAQSTASSAVAKGSTVGAGTLSIQLGSWTSDSNGTPAAFTAGSAAAVSVTVSASDSLSSIASKINGASAGVTATVLVDSSGERLLLRSKTTGEASGFRVQATEDSSAPGLSALAFDPQTASGVGMAANLSAYQSAQNAKATLNGVEISSTTNTFAEAIPGMSLTVAQVTTTAAEVHVVKDSEGLTKNIQAFVDAYNAVNDLLSTSTKYDAETKTVGILQGDSTTLGFMNGLRNMVSSLSGSETFKRLSDAGVEVLRGGNLKVDSTKLTTAMKDFDNLKAAFVSTDSKGLRTNGFAGKMKAYTSEMLSFDGSLNSKTDALQAASDRNKKEQDKVEDKATALETRLAKQYSALDTKMASLSALNAYITQQVTNWNKS